MQSKSLISFGSLAILKQEVERRLTVRESDNATWFAETANLLMQSPEEPEPTVELLRLCVRFFVPTREKQLGIAIAERAIELAVVHHFKDQERMLCNMLGMMHKDSGRFVPAIDWFVRGISVARSISDRSGESQIWTNMASAANMMGLHDDAIKFARRSLALAAACRDDGARLARVGASQILARACMTLGRMDDALVAVRNARRELPTPRTTWDFLNCVRLHHTHTVVAIRQELIDEAREASAAAVADAEHCTGPEAMVHAGVCQALVDAYRGDVASADRVTQALLTQYGRDAGLMHDLYSARLYVLDRAGRQEEADTLRMQFRRDWQSKKMNDVIAQLRFLEQSQRDRAGSGEAMRERLEELAIIGELHDDSTGEHAFRVGRLAGLLARRLGLPESEAAQIELAARLHDIGKITTPPEILTKPGSLSEDEWRVMQQHTQQGFEILQGRGDALIEMAATIALCHHEWFDGKGYPRGLKGDEIPLVAQIVALADVFDALSHARCYKPAWPIDAALAEIRRLSNSQRGRHQFDTHLATEFIAVIDELVAKYGSDGLDDYLSLHAAGSQLQAARSAAASSLQAEQITGVR
jgi:putative two-component system response regulator